MSSDSLEGTFTALVTPFTADGLGIDWNALDDLVEAQLAGGVSGLVPCGTTGEAPTLSDSEQLEVISRVASVTRGRAMVLAGTGSFSTQKTIDASQAALRAGADGVMIVMPYYSKPSQEGLVMHALAVAHAVEAPVVLYNIPGRSIVDLSAESTERICQSARNVVGLKDATGNVLRCQELVHRLGDRLSILCGDDSLTVAMMAVGARGVISVTSNVRPSEVSHVTRLALNGDFSAARRAQAELLNLHTAMFLEPNPGPAKAALASMGRMTDAVRAPLLAASETTRLRILEALRPWSARQGSAPTSGAGS